MQLIDKVAFYYIKTVRSHWRATALKLLLKLATPWSIMIKNQVDSVVLFFWQVAAVAQWHSYLTDLTRQLARRLASEQS